MSNLQITYNDAENILLTANKEKPYLVYSCRNRKLPKPSGENKINDRQVLVCWASKEDKADVVVILLDETKTAELIEQCIKINRNGGKTKFIPFLYDKLQPIVMNLNREIELKTAQSPLTKFKMELEKGIGFVPVTKKSYVVHVRYEPTGVKVYNKLEDAHYTTTNERHLVLSGTVGEEWVIDNKKFLQTYRNYDGEPLTEKDIEFYTRQGAHPNIVSSIDGNDVVWAKQVPTNLKLEVATSWGEVLTANRDGVPHGSGDFIMAANTESNKPSKSDRWIVNGEIFGKTYQKAGSSDEIKKEKLTAEMLENQKLIKHYTALQQELLSKPFDSFLARPYNSYYRDAQRVFDQQTADYKYYDECCDVVERDGKHYLVKHRDGFLITGSVEKDFVSYFKELNSYGTTFLLEEQFGLALGLTHSFKKLAEKMERYQLDLELSERQEAYKKGYEENEKTLFGKIKNRLNR